MFNAQAFYTPAESLNVSGKPFLYQTKVDLVSADILTPFLTLKINPQSCVSHTRESELLLQLHSSVLCCAADVLSTSLTSANGSCPHSCGAPPPPRPCCPASPDCFSGTRNPRAASQRAPRRVDPCRRHKLVRT